MLRNKLNSVTIPCLNCKENKTNKEDEEMNEEVEEYQYQRYLKHVIEECKYQSVKCPFDCKAIFLRADYD